MSTSEILAELPKLKAEDRQQVFQRLCELQEADLVNGIEPSEAEKQILDAALADYKRDGDRGQPWRDVINRIRTTGQA